MISPDLLHAPELIVIHFLLGQIPNTTILPCDARLWDWDCDVTLQNYATMYGRDPSCGSSFPAFENGSYVSVLTHFEVTCGCQCQVHY
jgi:hypothetical protein